MKKILLLALVVCTSVVALAQKPTTKSTAKQAAKTATQSATQAVTTPEPPPPAPTAADLLYEEMLPSTAKVMFIDSVVVPKAKFLSYIPLTPTQGKMMTGNNTVGYANEFDSKRIFAASVEVDSMIERHLYSIERDGKTWTQPHQLSELETNLSECDYPFLLADGVTFYFAGKGEGSVGGYDIFKTTYDPEEFQFLEPSNMGLPFNSKANEYFMAINDQQNLGWLVTDRNQPEDTVCIYTFEPLTKRVNHDPDTPEEELLPYAEIQKISDTWSFGNYDAAKKRQKELYALLKAAKAEEKIRFVVSDEIVYTSISEFKSNGGADRYRQIITKKEELQQLEQMLEVARSTYRSSTNKAHLATEIANNEEAIEAALQAIKTAEKQLRQAERAANK